MNRKYIWASTSVLNQFVLRCLLNILVKSLGKDDFKYLTQDFDKNVSVLVKQKGFYHYDNMSDFETEFPSKGNSAEDPFMPIYCLDRYKT